MLSNICLVGAGIGLAGNGNEAVTVLNGNHLPMTNSLLQNGLPTGNLAPMPGQQHSLMAAGQLDNTFSTQPPSVAPAMPSAVMPPEDQPPSDMLKAQAQTLKVRSRSVS